MKSLKLCLFQVVVPHVYQNVVALWFIMLDIDFLTLVLCANSVLRNQELVNGRTGNVSFNGAGDRVNAVYEIVNIQSSGSVPVGNCVVSNVSYFRCCLG